MTSTVFVVNVGRPVGTSLDAIGQYIAKDSTYGPLHRYLHGRGGVRRHQGRGRGRGASSVPTAKR